MICIIFNINRKNITLPKSNLHSKQQKSVVHWSSEEDRKLEEALKLYSPKDSKRISSILLIK